MKPREKGVLMLPLRVQQGAGKQEAEVTFPRRGEPVSWQNLKKSIIFFYFYSRNELPEACAAGQSDRGRCQAVSGARQGCSDPAAGVRKGSSWVFLCLGSTPRSQACAQPQGAPPFPLPKRFPSALSDCFGILGDFGAVPAAVGLGPPSPCCPFPTPCSPCWF